MKVTFQSVTEIILSLIIENDTTQMDFMFDLFASFCDYDAEFNMDNGQIHHWLKGNQKVSPKIVNYYNGKDKHEVMAKDLEAHILPYVSDLGLLNDRIHDLLISDMSISSTQKEIILGYYNRSSASTIAAFLSEVLIFGFSRPFDKKDSSTETSPSLSDIIITTANPKPVSTFIGREKELDEVDKLLSDKVHVFINGIPGIGKSEFAKQYAKLHKKDYTNILYLEYTDTLYNLISDLDFVDDTDDLTDRDRFRKHFRVLKSLKEDSLIIVDNFDATANSDSMFATFNGLKCSILYTTRFHFEGCTEYTLESSKELAAEIFKANSSSDYSINEINELLETVDYHVMTSELLGRLIAYNSLTATQLKQQLTDNTLLKEEHQNVRLNKDNHATKGDYQSHLLRLLRYEELELSQQKLISLLALGPETGFSLFYLKTWYGNCINDLQDLEEMGLLEVNHFIVKLHPYIRKIINSGTYLSLESLGYFFKNLDSALSDDTNNSSLLALEIIQNACKYLQIEPCSRDTWSYYVCHSMECSRQRKKYGTFRYLLSFYEGFLGGKAKMDALQAVLYEHYLAISNSIFENNINAAIKHELDAIKLYNTAKLTDAQYIVASYIDIANYYQTQSNLTQASFYLMQGVRIIDDNQLKNTILGATSYSQYGKLLIQQNKYQEALFYYQACVNAFSKIGIASGLAYAYAIQNLAAIQAGNRHYNEAIDNYTKALNLFRDVVDAEDPLISFCQNQLIELNKKKANSSRK